MASHPGPGQIRTSTKFSGDPNCSNAGSPSAEGGGITLRWAPGSSKSDGVIQAQLGNGPGRPASTSISLPVNRECGGQGLGLTLSHNHMGSHPAPDGGLGADERPRKRRAARLKIRRHNQAPRGQDAYEARNDATSLTGVAGIGYRAAVWQQDAKAGSAEAMASAAEPRYPDTGEPRRWN